METELQCNECKIILGENDKIGKCLCNNDSNIWCIPCAKRFVMVFGFEEHICPPNAFCIRCLRRAVTPILLNSEQTLKDIQDTKTTQLMIFRFIVQCNQVACGKLVNNESSEREVLAWRPARLQKTEIQHSLDCRPPPETISMDGLESEIIALPWPITLAKAVILMISYFNKYYPSICKELDRKLQLEEDAAAAAAIGANAEEQMEVDESNNKKIRTVYYNESAIASKISIIRSFENFGTTIITSSSCNG
jgi:hypothetical protein